MRRIGAFLAVVCAVTGLLGAARAVPDDNAGVPPVRLTQINGFAMSAMAIRPGDPDIYVTQLNGYVDQLHPGQKDASRVLDLRHETSAGAEQGLLGLVFSPDGSKMYVLYTARNNATHLEEYAFANGVADPASRRTLLTIPRRQPDHNGGQLAFGPDGMLYIGLGDGGGGNDRGPGHTRGGNGQSLGTLLGKILRIDPTPSGNAPYTIPPDNPFANGGGRPEIWAYGLRNPWRFSFDRQTGDLWIGDVGENTWEEVDLAPAAQGRGRGVNFGWNVYEGPVRIRKGTPTGGSAQPPLFSIAHTKRTCTGALIAGYVYRGSRIPGLDGTYIYGDFCSPAIHWLREVDGVVTHGSLGVSARDLASFGQDANGELYVLSLSSGLYRIDPR